MSRREKQDSSPLTLFYSYADKDEELREELEKHLSLLQRQRIIAGWHHHKILPGANKNQINDDWLSSAQIIILLISPDFLASDASYSEMQRALQHHEAGLAHVIPLLLRPVDWEQAPFAHLQALPRDGQPVTMWKNRDLAFLDIAKGLRSAIEQWNASRNHSLHQLPQSTISVQAIAHPVETADRLEIQFSRACHVHRDDNAILETFEAMNAARSRYPNLRSFTEEELERINQARERKKAQEDLQQALRIGSLEQIEAVYNPKLIDNTLLILDELRRAELACSLMDAYREENDEAFMMIFKTVSPADYQIFFIPQDWEIINTVRRRRHTLMEFRTTLGSRRLQPIVNAYFLTQNGYKHLTERERELVALAQEFVQAYHAGDDAAIVAAENKITNSPYNEFIAFTIEEREHIERAQSSVAASNQIIAKVKNREITIAMIKKVCKVKEPYIRYLVDSLQQKMSKAVETSDKEKIQDQISIWQSKIDPQQLPIYALEDFIDNIFIEDAITEKQQQGMLPDYRDVLLYLNMVKRYAVPDYYTLLKMNRLTEKDVEEVLLLFLRRDLLSGYFQTQLKLARLKFPFVGIEQENNMLEKWLEKQRKDAKVTYIQYGSNRGLWLSMLLEQAT